MTMLKFLPKRADRPRPGMSCTRRGDLRVGLARVGPDSPPRGRRAPAGVAYVGPDSRAPARSMIWPITSVLASAYCCM